MQIKITYKDIIPKLLFDEIKDLVQKQGMVAEESVLSTYSLPTDSSSYVARGTLTFNIDDETDSTDKECLRAHIVGLSKGNTKLMLDIDEELFPPEKISDLLDDMDFIFGQYKVEQH